MDFVFLHGTAQGPGGWQRLTNVLEARGHRTIAVDFPVDRPDMAARDYAAYAAGQVTDMAAPIVVAHSGAGLLLPAAAERLQASHLVWVAAAVPDFAGGASFTEQITRDPELVAGDEWREYGRLSVEDPVVAAYFGFHDCDLVTLRWAVSTMRLFYPAAVYAEAPPADPPTAPSTYVLARHDRTLRPEWLREIARERLGVEPVEVDGGHFPHVSRPTELADILERTAAT